MDEAWTKINIFDNKINYNYFKNIFNYDIKYKNLNNVCK